MKRKGPDKDPQNLRDVASLISAFLKANNLTSDKPEHDAIHAMTGIGINIADEARVAAVEVGAGARGHGFGSLKKAHAEAAKLYKGLKRAMTAAGGTDALVLGRMQMPSAADIAEHYALGQLLDSEIRRLTGRPYREIKPEEIMKLDVSGLSDLPLLSRDIRARHETPLNRQLARVHNRLLEEDRRPRRVTPPAGQSGPR